MKVTNLKHESSSVNNIVLNSDGSVGGELATTLASKLDLAGGKILQIVRATDSTNRSTTSTSAVDASISVTITPQKADSAIIVFWAARVDTSNSTDDDLRAILTITDNSNNALSGAENYTIGTSNVSGTSLRAIRYPIWMSGYSTPATTSATTYKVRWQVVSSNCTLQATNSSNTGEMYAIEVSA